MQITIFFLFCRQTADFGRLLLAATKVEINLIICWTRNAVAFAQLHGLAFVLLALLFCISLILGGCLDLDKLSLSSKR